MTDSTEEAGTRSPPSLLVLAGSLAALPRQRRRRRRQARRDQDRRRRHQGGRARRPSTRPRAASTSGIISDLTVGPFKALAVPITDAQKKFWERVNKAGGIGGYEIDVDDLRPGQQVQPEMHNQVYQEIKGKVLALAQTLGSPTTAAIIADLKANNVVAAPASWTSAWAFEDVIIESGANYCFESMNAVDYAVESVQAEERHGRAPAPATTATTPRPARSSPPRRNGLTFINVKTDPGQDKQAGAIDAIVAAEARPGHPHHRPGRDRGDRRAGRRSAGTPGKFIGTSPTWNPGLLQSAAAPALKALYLQSAPWQPYVSDTAGPQGDARGARLRGHPERGLHLGLGVVVPAEGGAGEGGQGRRPDPGRPAQGGQVADARWTTRACCPSGAGNYAGGPDAGQFRQSIIANPAGGNGTTDVPIVKDFFVGPTAEKYNLDKPCFQKL